MVAANPAGCGEDDMHVPLNGQPFGIERFDDEHDRWSSTPGGVARAYQAALDDLAEGRLTAWQRMNFDRLRLRS